MMSPPVPLVVEICRRAARSGRGEAYQSGQAGPSLFNSGFGAGGQGMASARDPFEVLDALQSQAPNALRFFCALCLVMDVPSAHNDRLCRFLEQTYARPFVGDSGESVDACARVFEGVFEGCEHGQERHAELLRTLANYVEA